MSTTNFPNFKSWGNTDGLTEDSVDNVFEKSRLQTCRMLSNPVRAGLYHYKHVYAVISQVTLFKHMCVHREGGGKK